MESGVCSLRVQTSSVLGVRSNISVASIGVSMPQVLQWNNSAHLSRAILACSGM